MLVLGLVAGECYNGVTTSERAIAFRALKQEPVRQAEFARAAATDALREAEATLARVQATTARIATAQEGKDMADEAVFGKAADRNCVSNCREILRKASDDASGELMAAWAELAAQRIKVEADVVAARAALATVPHPVTGRELADRLNVSSWLFDLLVGALQAIATNFLGYTLIAFGAHGLEMPRFERWGKALPVPAEFHAPPPALNLLSVRPLRTIEFEKGGKLVVYEAENTSG